MSILSPRPPLSIVVGSGGQPGLAAACLEALEPQRDETEVVVCQTTESPPALRERFPWVRFIVKPGALVPQLWADGIAHTQGERVALTIAPMVPAPNWVQTIRAHPEEALAGAIEPGSDLRLTDWAEYFCRYARDMLPFVPHECRDLPGDNSAYQRELLDRTQELYREGFWEPVVNRRLADEGVVLWHTPDLVVHQGRSAGIRAFIRQRLAHGRAYGLERGSRFGAVRNLAGLGGAPLVPGLMTARILREVFGKRRHRLRALRALPLILVFNVAWAAGEARGHLHALRGR